MDAELEGVPATDELRRQIAEVIADYHGRMIQAHTLFRSYELAGELLPLVVAVVAEARTEAVETAERIAATFRENEDRFREMGHTSIGIEYSRKALGAEEVAVVLRGVGNQKVGVTVDDLALDEMDGNQNAEPWGIAEFGKAMAEGNQNAEPRWSANRLEEVLREGLNDYYVRKGSKPDLATKIENARAHLDSKESALRHATWAVESAQRDLDELLADQKGTEQ